MSTSQLSAIASALDLDINEDEVELLRDQMKADPIRGAPIYAKLRGDLEPAPLEPGQWADINWTDETGELPANCPVIPLGMDEKHAWFISPLGHVRSLGDTAGKTPLLFLLAGRTRWLEWAFPRRNAKGLVAGFAAEDALPALLNACAWKGGFALEDQVRGRGAWLDDDGSLIYHAGDSVFIGGVWKRCGPHGRFIYPIRPKIGRPSERLEREGEGSPGDCLLKVLETFNWDRKKLDPRLALGWTMTAKVGGALRRRPVLFVSGEEGSGKSTFQELIRLALNQALMSTSNTTQAGIYQRTRQDSVAICVDEMEAKDDTRVVDKILELARIAYSGDKMQRGGKDGQASEFALMSSFMGSSIAKPATDAQDDSRMAALVLRPRPLATRSAREIDAQTLAQWAADSGLDSPIEAKDVEKWGRELLRRWFNWWPRWDQLMRVFRQALKSVGHDDRGADTFGALAAGYHVAMHDDMPTVEQIKEWLVLLAPTQLSETSGKERTSQRCFAHLLQARPDSMRGQAFGTVEECLMAFRNGRVGNGDWDAAEPIEDVNKRLYRFGVKLSWEKSAAKDWDSAWLFVPDKHEALHALFQGTPWAGKSGAKGPWLGVLGQLPSETIIKDVTLRLGALNMRGMKLRVAALVGADVDGDG